MKKIFIVLLLVISTIMMANAQPLSYVWSMDYTELPVSKTFVDEIGNVYLIGSFYNSIDLNLGAGSDIVISNGSSDIFFAKYDKNGNYLWGKSVGGIGGDNGNEIIVDNQLNIYIAGTFQDTVDFDSNIGINNLVYLSGNIFFAKYDINGNYIYAKNIGSSDLSNFNSLNYKFAIDNQYNLYLLGVFIGEGDFDPSSSYVSMTGDNSLFLAKYDANGGYLWSGTTSRIFPLGYNYLYNIAIDNNNSIYLTGSFWNSVDFDISASTHYISSLGSADIFFAKYSSSGNLVFTKTIGSLGGEGVTDILIDNSKSIIIMGQFSGMLDFDPSGNMVTLNSQGYGDIFIAKYDSVGNYTWAKSFGGVGVDKGNSICIDASNNLYTTGLFNGNACIDPLGSIGGNATSQGDADIFFSKYNSNCELIWAKSMGTFGYDTGYYIKKGGSNNIYLVLQCSDSLDVDFDQNVIKIGNGIVKYTELPTSIEESLSNIFEVYPNPTLGSVSIKSNQILNNILVEIIDIGGRIIYSRAFEDTNFIDLILGEKGVYFIRVEYQNELHYYKVIKI